MNNKKEIEEALQNREEQQMKCLNGFEITLVDWFTGEVCCPNTNVTMSKQMKAARQVITRWVNNNSKCEYPCMIEAKCNDPRLEKHLSKYIVRILKVKGLNDELGLEQSLMKGESEMKIRKTTMFSIHWDDDTAEVIEKSFWYGEKGYKFCYQPKDSEFDYIVSTEELTEQEVEEIYKEM